MEWVPAPGNKREIKWEKWKWDEMVVAMNRTGERAAKRGHDASHDYTGIRTCGLSTLSLISLHVRWWASAPGTHQI